MNLIRKTADKAMGTKRFVCPEKGCGIVISVRGTSAAEVLRMKGLAEDHSKHSGRVDLV